MRVLILNAGSSSLKYKLFNSSKNFSIIFQGIIEAIGEKTSIWRHNDDKQQLEISNHYQAMQLLSDRISNECNDVVNVVGHRVVHGGNYFNAPTLINDEVISRLIELTPLAPLHNPANVTCIELAREQFPFVAHIAFFDTAFHQTIPDYAHQYAIDIEVANQYAIRRYGFHGTNHHYVAEQAAQYLQKPLAQCQLINLHLGNGASACLIKEGKSYDTSMGMTPLAGLMMGTRCGDIDPSISYYLGNQGFSAQQIDDLYNKKSGLKGICGVNDMREVEHRALQGDDKAKLALTMFCYRIQQYIGAYLSQTPQLDAVIFTGGIGENSTEVRHGVIKDLFHLGLELDEDLNNQRMTQTVTDIARGPIKLLVIQGDEEFHMAKLATGFKKE